ncbi:MAG: amidohydrolase [Sphingobacteriales bacterium]|nr:MAG: amidohydrolase [Sphingobacteriales bacterium]
MKIVLTVIPCLLFSSLLSSQSKSQTTHSKNTSNPAWVKTIPVDDLIKWRRQIHENAELSFKEDNTSKYVAGILRSLRNIEIIKPAKTSVIGILKGSQPGKTVAFRADMDGLPIQEETGLGYASKNKGVSHACGHDAHTAMLLATATTLSKMKDKIKGTVYFIFQHAEEQAPGGAIDLVKSGVLKDVGAFFGMHVLPNFPTGHIGILPDGAASTTSDEFDLSIIVKCESAEEQRACELEPRYFHPAYLGPAGWVGFDLSSDRKDKADSDVWAEAAELIDCSYRVTAPKRAIARLDAGEGPDLGVQQWN